MDNRELFDEVAGTYKREIIDLTREETLHACFGPVLHTHMQWKDHPETFVQGTDMDQYLKEMKAYYKVTPTEWVEIEDWFYTGVREVSGLRIQRFINGTT